MEIMNRKQEIKALMNECYPNLRGYYLDFLDDMLAYLDKLDERERGPKKLALTWTYPETLEVRALNDAVDRIKSHLIDGSGKEDYTWYDDKPKNDYERGLYNAMRLLHMIVHWINPS